MKQVSAIAGTLSPRDVELAIVAIDARSRAIIRGLNRFRLSRLPG
jgi:hypothetical protein